MDAQERKLLYSEIIGYSDADPVNWSLRDLGQHMSVLEKDIGGWWKSLYLIDERAGSAMQFMDENEILLNVRDEDIDWTTVRGLPGEELAAARNGHFPTNIRGFCLGVAEVEWQISPDGRYYMDNDGFGMTNDREVSLFGYIDRRGNVVAPFTYIGSWPCEDFEKLRALRNQARMARRR